MLSSPILPIVLAIGLAIGLWVVFRAARSLEWGLLALVFFMPFERIPSFEAFGFNFKINHFLGGILMVLWLLAIAFDRRRLEVNGLVAPLGLMFAAFLASATQAQFLSRAVIVLIVTTFTVALGLLIPQLLRKRDQVRPLLVVLGVTTLITLFFGLFQFAGDLVGLSTHITGLDPGYTKAVFGFPRIQAFSHEPLYLGDFLLVPISLTLALLAVRQRWFSRPVLFGFLGLTAIVFALTLARGAFVGLFAALVVLLLLLGKRFLTPRTLGLIGGGVLFATLAVTLILGVISPQSQQRFIRHLTVQDFGKSESTAGRLESWYQAIDLWKGAPILGIGPGNFGPAILGYPAQRPPRGWPIVNNEYFELLAETGAVGLALFLLFCAALLWRSWRAYQLARDDPEMRAVVVGLTAAVVGILVQYNFFSTLYINQVWLSFGLLMAVQGIVLYQKRRLA